MPTADMKFSPFSIPIILARQAVLVGAHPMVSIPLSIRSAGETDSYENGQPLDRVYVAVLCLLFAIILAFVQGKYRRP